MVFDQDKDEDGNEVSKDLIGRIWITLQPDVVTFVNDDGT